MSLDGINDVPSLPGNNLPAGVDLGTAIVLPPGGQVFYVRGNGTSITPFDRDPPGLQDRLIASVQKACSYCVANRGDTVVVLQGHTETISGADGWSNMVAGTRVIGLGVGNNRPTITWSATASTMLLNDANCTLENLRLLLAPNAGSVTVTAAITASAAGVAIRRCYIEAGTTAARFTTTAITVASGADDFQFVSNECWGDVTATPTDFLLVNAAVKRSKIVGNNIQVATSATGHPPLVFATAAAVDVFVANNYIAHKLASSTVGILGIASLSGVAFNNVLSIQAAGAATGITTPGNLTMFGNLLAQPGKQAIATTVGGNST